MGGEICPIMESPLLQLVTGEYCLTDGLIKEVHKQVALGNTFTNCIYNNS